MSVLILKYKDNFADNLSELAYGAIIEEKTNKNCYFENDSQKRRNFELKMKNFNMDFRYLSKNQVDSIVQKSYLFSRKLIKQDKIKHELKRFNTGDKIINIDRFKIDDIDLITDKVRENFKFRDINFVTNFDMLDEINSNNSIGLYINRKDLTSVNQKYIFKAVQRLNKYIKKPKLYIFTSQNNLSFAGDIGMSHKILDIPDWREEFYLLTQCKNKIILSDTNSYSAGLWASVLSEKTYLTTFDSALKVKKSPENWIKI